jgi:hypothetical protein
MPWPAKVVLWIVAFVVGAYSFFQALEYFLDKYKKYGPGAHQAAHRWVNESPFISTIAVGLCLGLVFAVVGGTLFHWWAKRDPAKAASAAGVEPKGSKPKTLHELFKSDCPQTKMFSSYVMTGNTNGKPTAYTIEYSLCGDFKTKTYYISFFLPRSDVHTLAACKFLPAVFKRITDSEQIKTLMQGIVHQAPGEHPETWAQLTRSTRLYVYHETQMLRTDIDLLVADYQKEGLAPQFRGRDYEILRNSPLYDTAGY